MLLSDLWILAVSTRLCQPDPCSFYWLVGCVMFFCASSVGLADTDDTEEWDSDYYYHSPTVGSVHHLHQCDKMSKMGSLMFVVNCLFYLLTIVLTTQILRTVFLHDLLSERKRRNLLLASSRRVWSEGPTEKMSTRPVRNQVSITCGRYSF